MKIADDKKTTRGLDSLKRKAEICRHAHSCLKETNEVRSNYIRFSAVFLSLIMAALVALVTLNEIFFINKTVSVILLICLPLIVAFLEALGDKIFGFSAKAKEHEKSVFLWGAWIRGVEARESKEKETPMKNEESDIHKDYISCMDRTCLIPNKKFLKYKAEYYIKRKESESLDEMSLEELKKFKPK